VSFTISRRYRGRNSRRLGLLAIIVVIFTSTLEEDKDRFPSSSSGAGARTTDSRRNRSFLFPLLTATAEQTGYRTLSVAGDKAIDWPQFSED